MIDIPPDDPLDWRDRYITYEGRNEYGEKMYIAWSESYDELGAYPTWDEAAMVLDEYAKTLG